jgi:hypothetical protein
MEDVPYGLNVDETVVASPLNDIPADSLGYSNHLNDLDPTIVFASFNNRFDVYTDYNRVFTKGNVDPLNFPAFNESYPDASGVGVGPGLKYNIGTLILHSPFPISAIKVKPPCTLDVSISSSIDDIPQFVGSTITSNNGLSSELFFLANKSNFVSLDHIGSLSLYEIEIFTPDVQTQFTTFPLLNNGKTMPYLVSKFGSLDSTRKGGLQNETFNIHTTDVSTLFSYTRTVKKSVSNLSLEKYYLQEYELYNHILKDINFMFPVISSIERNCLNHKAKVQKSLESINYGGDEQMTQYLQCIIQSEIVNGILFFNGVQAQNLQIIAGVKYIFQPEPIEVNGNVTSELKLNEGDSILLKNNNVSLGIISATKKLPKEVYDLPQAFMNDTSLNDVLNDISVVSESLKSLTLFSRTLNSGNTISHAVFIDENGKTLSCEESIFLPSEIKTISVYCSDPDEPVQILIDGQLTNEVRVSTLERLSIVEIEIPNAAGVHALTTNNGSNLLFRVSEKSLIHAPIHPSYYTSGQLERDTYSSSYVNQIAQLNNFDLINDTRMIARSNCSLISIQDTLFENYSCTGAFFCRKKAVDLKNSQITFDNFESKWDFCEQHPWLACLDVRNGCGIINSQINLTNFTFWWYRNSFDDVTIIQSGYYHVYTKNNKLVVKKSDNIFECNAGDINVSYWTNITFTNNTLYINGKKMNTLISDISTSTTISTGTVVGTTPKINIKSLLSENPLNIILQDFAKTRFNESKIILQNIDSIQSFDMTVILSDSSLPHTLMWYNTNTETLPVQEFKLNTTVTSVYCITGINLPFSIPKIEIKFNTCGFIRNLCTYSDNIPEIIIKSTFENRDNVIDFQKKTVLSLCTNQELNTVKTEQYNQTNFQVDGTFNHIVHSSPSSFYVTPPSLIMMSTSQNTAYSLSQSILILFNRRIEVFLRDDSTLFTMSGSDGSTTLIKANFCTLLSSQISIPNIFLNLSPATTYTVHLARARLFQFDGHVPCLEGTISFTTE